MAVSYGLVQAFDLSATVPVTVPIFTSTNATTALADTAVSLIIAWLAAALLLAMNRSLYMLLEGYGRFNPAKLLAWREKYRYRALVNERKKQEQTYYRSSNDPAKQEAINLQLGEIDLQLAEQFPDDEESVLPTRFGNTLRAFEVYSRVLYGLEAIEGWSRLLSVVPKDYRELINDAKAQTDFWLNVWALSLVSILEYLIFSIAVDPRLLWFPVAALLLAFVAAWGARIAAVEWGDVVKATFDTFLPELGAKLGIPSNATRKDQDDFWYYFSNAIRLRSERALRLLDQKIEEVSDNVHDGLVNPRLEYIYTVRDGDTLASVAQRLGIAADVLARANSMIIDDELRVGQKLQVPFG